MIAAATAEAASIPPQERVEAEVVAPQVMQEVEARATASWEAAMVAAAGSRQIVEMAGLLAVAVAADAKAATAATVVAAD